MTTTLSTGGAVYWKFKWKDYPKKQASWEADSQTDTCAYLKVQVIVMGIDFIFIT